MEDILVPIGVVGMLFIGLPWLIFHYVTKWKTSATITNEDENLLSDLYNLSRRLDDRMDTIERIIAADNPNWKSGQIESTIENNQPKLERFDELLRERNKS